MADPPRLTRAHEGSLVLVRHGESEWIVEGRFQGRRDPPLSPLGERQAALVADRLRHPEKPPPLPVDGAPLAIVHSPLARAARTAELIAERHVGRVPLQPSPELTELAQGDWEGRLHAEVAAEWPELLAAWRREPAQANAPGGERLVDAAARVRTALERILVLLSAAGVPVPSATSPVLGYPGARAGGIGVAPPPDRPWVVVVAHDGIFRLAVLTLLELPLERFWSFPFALCGISVVGIRGGAATLRAHNLTAHLAPLAAHARAAAEASGDRRGAL